MRAPEHGDTLMVREDGPVEWIRVPARDDVLTHRCPALTEGLRLSDGDNQVVDAGSICWMVVAVETRFERSHGIERIAFTAHRTPGGRRACWSLPSAALHAIGLAA